MPLTCLIAAHDPWFLQLLRMFIEESGFQTVQVYEAQDILPMIHKEHPIVVVMQADLPGTIKGMDVLQDLQGDPETGHIPVLLVAAHGHGKVDGVREDRQQGAAAYLEDPITYESFQDALQKAGVRRPGSGAGANYPQTNPPTPKFTDDKFH